MYNIDNKNNELIFNKNYLKEDTIMEQNIFYKYYNKDGIRRILCDKPTIRFTPAKDENDELEGDNKAGNFSDYIRFKAMSEDDEKNFIDKLKSNQGIMSILKECGLSPESIVSSLSKTTERGYIAPLSREKEGFYNLVESNKTYKHDFGILSLSENGESKHLAQMYSQHSGVVIGLNVQNEFFQSILNKHSANKFAKVTYSNEGVYANTETDSSLFDMIEKVFFHKYSQWSEEEEWRFLVYISETFGKLCEKEILKSDEILDNKIGVFYMPISAISNVKVLSKTSDDDVEYVKNFCEKYKIPFGKLEL